MIELLRLADFDHGLDSRKVLLLSGVGALWTLLAMLVNDDSYANAQPAIVDLALLDRYFAVFIGAQLLQALLALPPALRGQPARWTAYLYALAVGPFVAALLHLYGTMSTPLVAVFPVVAIILTLYFDEWIGCASLVSFLSALAVLRPLEQSGTLPYAPLFVARNIEAGNSHLWFYSFFAGILILAAWAFLLSLQICRDRQQQEQRLRRTHAALDRSNRLIRRYLPGQVADHLDAVEADIPRPSRRRLTILFSDIKGFTHAADELEAEELTGILNDYLSEMMTIADRHAATVSQMVGDGLMMLFGAPQPCSDQDHALRAVTMAMAMQQRMQELQEVWFQRGYQRPFQIRIGINTGEAVVGEFGSDGRKLYSAVGVQAKLAERLQSCCEPGRVLISDATMALVRERVPFTLKGEIQLGLRPQAVRVYELNPLATPAPQPQAPDWDWTPPPAMV